MKVHILSFKQRVGAFTLIELLVVIAIISLLSSVVFASVNSARVKARDSRRMQDVVQLRNALNLYASSNNGSYPAGDYWSHFTSTGSTIYEWSDFAAFLVPT